MYTPKRTAHYFNLARNAGQFSDFKQHHLGCVLVYKNNVISVGYNTTKQHPMQKQYNALRGFDASSAHNSTHAEMSAIIKAKDMDVDWGKVSIFIYREHKDGCTGLAKPCAACAQKIRDMGIKEIYYTGEGSHIYERIE